MTLSPQDIAPSRTALLVIDIQNDFGAPGFAMAHAGMALEPVEAAISCAETLITAARRAGVTPWFIRVVTRPETDPRALRRFMVRAGMADDIAICRAGTPGVDYYRISPEEGEPEVEKLLYSAFAGTDLAGRLRESGVETLMLCGLTTDCCVDATARDGFHRDFDIFIASDACAAFDPRTHENALAILSTHCATPVTTQEILTAWEVN
ncbi:isochorismatase [Gluconacetobacter liquefaciens]|uniref:Cysteine hydrolase n=1 Tax=Gluconacetobacter liquefaciens TaxID=89584 RepID=A0A370FZ99_GLULI|nr:cysteine hydrolase [Gluconacetobacter liquefaciens]MBB2187300.1 cysteine hydrolase [Gluconacetobacter liquefaciens]RDI36852.1 nicotinamidase-related amidase [Gluconacetobacter liquefaciens]GBQ94135.1 isochorismatase hydrolase [Gluconacetobacter liquefaciens NRIC 0522]GEB39357.1 isochorismatase [Gluconacetobacter liquefaciens]